MRFLPVLAVYFAKSGESPVVTDAGLGDLGAPPLCTRGAQEACACPGGASYVRLSQANAPLGPARAGHPTPRLIEKKRRDDPRMVGTRSDRGGRQP